MATEVKIPKLGLTMEEGTVAEWLVPDGGVVSFGQAVYRLETDKVETEVEAEGEGVLHQLVAEGTTLEPGAVVGWLLGDGEAAPDGQATDGETLTGQATDGQATAGQVTAAQAAPGRVLASPNARRVAAELGVDLATVTGTGPGGRIVAEDVAAAAAGYRGCRRSAGGRDRTARGERGTRGERAGAGNRTGVAAGAAAGGEPGRRPHCGRRDRPRRSDHPGRRHGRGGSGR